MNIQQLEYIVALDEFNHFRKAAEDCGVSQPTLSMMIKKLEDELETSLFDRSKKPVVPTQVGREVIAKARKAICEVQGITDVVRQHRGQVTGRLRIGIIPTLAPYLLPLFVQSLLRKYPDIELQVKEMEAEEIVEALKSGTVDAGIMVTPLENKRLLEMPVFHEKFYAYVAHSHPLAEKRYILPREINVNQLWLLKEGHCYRNQVVNLLEINESRPGKRNVTYEAGSIETLKKFVDQNNGITILPELALQDINEKEQQMVRAFEHPEPAREISLVMHRTYLKKQLIKALREEILAVIPPVIKERTDKGNSVDSKAH